MTSSIVRPPGIVASRLGAKRVTLTDLPSELPLLRRNVAANANANASAAGIDDGGEETWSYGDHQSDAGTKLRVMPCAWGDDAAPKVTLVGKGVCFDTGGLDIKPASAMLTMKKDMGGVRQPL